MNSIFRNKTVVELCTCVSLCHECEIKRPYEMSEIKKKWSIAFALVSATNERQNINNELNLIIESKL